MSINNYPYDVAFVRGVTELTNEQLRVLKSIGLESYSWEDDDPAHLQVWCGGLKEFAIVSDGCVRDALSYEDAGTHHQMFFDTVEDLISALS